jgi:hypothetical protein
MAFCGNVVPAEVVPTPVVRTERGHRAAAKRRNCDFPVPVTVKESKVLEQRLDRGHDTWRAPPRPNDQAHEKQPQIATCLDRLPAKYETDLVVAF